MPSFTYTARDSAGNALGGTVVADSADDVVAALRAEGKYPTSVAAAAETEAAKRGLRGEAAAAPRGGVGRIGRKDLIQISTQIAIMLETGVTLAEALDCIGRQSEKPAVKAVIEEVHRDISAGSDFSSALRRQPRSFPRLYVSLVQASEKSGLLSTMLHRATEYLRDEQETVRRVRGALTYPLFMLLFAIGTTTFLLAFVLPKFTAIYANKGAALPMPTQVLMALSGFLVRRWPYLLGAAAAAAAGGIAALRTRRGRRAFDLAQLRFPLLGAMFCKLHLSRGLRMIGTMGGAGVGLLDCVRTAHDLCGNGYFKDLWTEVGQQIEAGKQLSEPLFRSRLVPRSVAQMLHSAEKSGKLASVMEQVACYAEQELKEKIAETTRYVEPVMIAVMGFIIGGVALALMLPIFTISRVLAK